MYFCSLSLCDVVTAAVGHSRGRGLLKFSSGSPSPSGLNTRPPGQVQWVSEQWSPPVVGSSPSPVNPPPGLPSKNNEATSQDAAPLFALIPPVPSHSTPTLSLHSKDVAGQRSFGTPVTADLSPSAAAPRFATKRSEVHPATVNGDIPLMTSASDPLPVPVRVNHVPTVFRLPSPSLCISKPSRASPHHTSIHSAQQNSPTSPSSVLTPTMSPVFTETLLAYTPRPSSVSSVKSSHNASATTPSSGIQSFNTQSGLSPLAPLFVPRHCSADNSLVSVRVCNFLYTFCCSLCWMHACIGWPEITFLINTKLLIIAVKLL